MNIDTSKLRKKHEACVGLLCFFVANTCPRNDQLRLACISRDCKCDEVSDQDVLSLNLERDILALGENLAQLNLEPESH